MRNVEQATPRVFQPGDRFRDHFVVEAFLGEGGSGQVYRVRQRFTHEPYALKVGHVEDLGKAPQAARSLAEARATFMIQHRNVVKVHDLAVEANGMVWQLMDLLEGWSIAALIDRHGRLSPLYAVDIALEVAWGLQAAHEIGVVHRDVKPSNVVLTTSGQVKVLDFSLAKVSFLDLKTSRDHKALGTLAYMAPEHIRGASASPQFDVFSLGTMLWEMLVGRLPFGDRPAPVFEEVRQQLLEDAESLVTAAELPPYCEEVVRRAIAKDPRTRYEGMWALAHALGDLRRRLEADPSMALRVHHPPPWERAHRIARDPECWNQYRGPRSLPRDSPEPYLPSKRIVVSPAVGPATPTLTSPSPPARAPVAATIPMPAVAQPPIAGVAMGAGRATITEAGAPTVRGRPRPAPARRWALLLVTAVLAAAGICVWLSSAYDLPALLSSTPSRASPSAGPRRPPAPRAKR